MAQIIAMLSPAVMALMVWRRWNKRSVDAWENLEVYVVFVGLINMLCLGAVAVVFRHPDYIVNNMLFNTKFTFRYLALGFALAILLNVVWKILQCFNIGIVVEDVRDEEQ